MSELNADYFKGFENGKLFAQQLHDDQYWLRVYAGQAMQGMLAAGDHRDEDGMVYPSAVQVIAGESRKFAHALLAEVKRVENEQAKWEAEND